MGAPHSSYSGDCAERLNRHPRRPFCLSQPAYRWTAFEYGDVALCHPGAADVDYRASDFRCGAALAGDDDHRADRLRRGPLRAHQR